MRCGKFLASFLITFVLAAAADTQDLPKTIRGYSVYKADIAVSQDNANIQRSASDAVVELAQPVLKDVSATGVRIEMTARVKALGQSGKVDFIAFRNVRVNGIAVEIDEYRTAFAFRKGEAFALPRPAVIFIPTTQVIKAALREIDRPQDEWTVTGRIFVFGKFRKYGMDHKRVVPIDVTFRIANPLNR